jgi:pimeloyl-ACP methyl ester carboxylesterase
VTPRSRFITANRLRQHLLEWGGGGRVVLLLHGFLEHAHAWDLVAPGLAERGFHVFALDWRGHGDSEWIGAGGYYHFPDYAADLAFLVRELGGRAALVGHSMGATAAMQYAGTEPDRTWALVCVDALGPPDMADPATVPARFAAWIEDLERWRERDLRTMTLEEAKARLRERFPRFSPNVARLMAEHGTRARSGMRIWKFDPLHQTRAPMPFQRAFAMEIWRRVACPALYVEGAESPLRLPPDEIEARLAALRAERVTIAGSGHHPHLEQPDATTDALADFLRRVER